MIIFIKLAWKPSIAVHDVHIVQLSWRYFLINICFAVGSLENFETSS